MRIPFFKSIFGFPEEASGLLTSGCSASNLIGLALARNTMAGYDLRKMGLRSSPQKLVLYASAQAHSSLQKAVELLGLGGEALRKVPVDTALRIDLNSLKAAIQQRN